MNIKELNTIIKAAIALGHGEAELVMEEETDGIPSYHPAKVKFVNVGGQPLPDFVLALTLKHRRS